MNIILLCAGYATRLRPLTDHCPKPLLPIADRPMINYVMDKVGQIQKRRQIFLVSNAKFFDSFAAWKKDHYASEPIEILNDGSTTNENRLGAVRDIAFVLKGKKIGGGCLIIAGDNYFDFDLAKFTAFAHARRPHATLAVYDVKDLTLAKKYGLVTHDPSFRITAFQEKPAEPKTTLASTGVYFFPEESLRFFEVYLKDHQNPDAPGHYIEWLATHAQVFAFPFSGTWYDIGDLESYRKVEEEIRRRADSKK